MSKRSAHRTADSDAESAEVESVQELVTDVLPSSAPVDEPPADQPLKGFVVNTKANRGHKDFTVQAVDEDDAWAKFLVHVNQWEARSDARITEAK